MADIRWTEDQQKVIDLRDCSILVSAAAGSGKTAVLVERIIQKVMDPEHPLDLDRLLVVTFTRAAAAQMKDRIGAALEKRLQEEPDNVRLQRQETLLPTAMITTIDSFCKQVVQEHFQEIDLDPSFRIGEEAELELLRQDVLKDLLEEKYGEKEEAFTAFANAYGSMKSDRSVEDMVMTLFRMALSYPWPEEWLDGTLDCFRAESVEDMEQSVWMKTLEERLKGQLEDLMAFCDASIATAMDEDGPTAYVDVLQEDRAKLNRLLRCETYRELSGQIAGVSRNFSRLPVIRKSENPEKKDMVQGLRGEVKSLLGKMEKEYFGQPLEQVFLDMKELYLPMKGLVNLVREFMDRFAAAKEDRHLVDFNDLEHFALQILLDHGPERNTPTLAAEEYREQYEEIFIDEYQDSNYVQEMILTSISREAAGQPNLFMVGDVKQSIYKFRLARPELFMDKYHSFSTTEGGHRRVDLKNNFRSRMDSVLEPVNFIFRQIMTAGLGGVEYDEENALYQGGDYPAAEVNVADSCELLIVKAEESDEEVTERELEARAIARRIRELTDPETGMYIRDGDEYRLVRPGDIAILLRTMVSWADIFVDVLMEEGIPAYAETQRGYFGSIEIRTVLSLLQIIDNPRQDIPLATVMRSVIGGFRENEMAKVRSITAEGDYYDALCAYRLTGQDERLRTKIESFWQMLERLRERAPYLPTCDLIEEALEVTGFGEYAQALPGGEKRRANLAMLVQKAIDYEKTGYRGLFHFIRYIEKIRQYDIDYGDASIEGENKDSVVIMSIHKSKGLEFPVVFLGGLEKKFNHMDSMGKLIIHPDYGMGPDYRNPVTRRKTPTLLKKMLQQDMILADRGEELRVLYVALTRAKEKLILVSGHLPGRKMTTYQAVVSELADTKLPHLILSQCSSYLDWISLALIRHPAGQVLAIEKGFWMMSSLCEGALRAPIQVRLLEQSELVKESAEKKRSLDEKRIALHQLKEQLRGQEPDSPLLYQYIEERLSPVYSYADEMEIPVKYSVSELKKAGGRYEEDEEAVQLYEPPVPRFMELGEEPVPESDAYTGARLGTIYHKIMECLEWEAYMSREETDLRLKQLVAEGLMEQGELDAVIGDKIWDFLSSDLAARMANGTLKKEQPFVMGVQAREVMPDTDSEEMVLVQGIIDAFFREEDGLVVVDYKTDRVPRQGGREMLKDRYHTQLELYARALYQLTGHPVKACYIYSFTLGETILL